MLAMAGQVVQIQAGEC